MSSMVLKCLAPWLLRHFAVVYSTVQYSICSKEMGYERARKSLCIPHHRTSSLIGMALSCMEHYQRLECFVAGSQGTSSDREGMRSGHYVTYIHTVHTVNFFRYQYNLPVLDVGH